MPSRMLIMSLPVKLCGEVITQCKVDCSVPVLLFLNSRVVHTVDILSPFISVLCHSDWLFYGESCPHVDVVHPGRVWSSLPACTWHCSLHYLFLQATFLFPRGVTMYASFLALTVSNNSLVTPTLFGTHSFAYFAVHETCRIFLGPFISKASRRVYTFWVSSFHTRLLQQATLALLLVVSLLKSVCCDFSIFSAVMPRSPAPV